MARRQKAHEILKERAKEWLEDNGFTARCEVPLLRYVIDVIGEKEDEQLLIECGNTPNQKLIDLYNRGYKIMLWQYHESSPVFYSGEPIKYRKVPHLKIKKEMKPYSPYPIYTKRRKTSLGYWLYGERYCIEIERVRRFYPKWNISKVYETALQNCHILSRLGFIEKFPLI